MRRLLVIEDGNEYEEFARLFLADAFAIRAAHSAAEALALLREEPADGLLVDLRFDRSVERDLVGDIDETAERLFAGERESAIRYLRDNQGTLALAALREAGYDQVAVFVHDFNPRRLANLRRLYGDVRAVPSFDAGAIRRELGGGG
jgi:ActR/RegA family two-component response regulator